MTVDRRDFISHIVAPAAAAVAVLRPDRALAAAEAALAAAAGAE